MSDGQNLKQKETGILEMFRHLLPKDIFESYADLPLKLRIRFFQEIEQIMAYGSSEHIPITKLVFKQIELDILPAYALGKLVGFLPYLFDQVREVIPRFPASGFETVFEQVLNFGEAQKKVLLEEMIASPDLEKQSHFFKGYNEGLQKSLTIQEKYPGHSQNFKLYFTLSAFWPWIKDAENIAVLHEKVKEQKLYLGDEESFRRMCSRLGISLSERGRPKTKE